MARLYTKKVWFNDQTKLSAKNLNHIEKGIEAVAGAIDELEAKTEEIRDYVDTVSSGKPSNYVVSKNENQALNDITILTETISLPIETSLKWYGKEDLFTVGDLLLGDNIYIFERDVPDYFVAQKDNENVILASLEIKLDLSSLATIDFVNEKVGDINEELEAVLNGNVPQSNFDEKVSNIVNSKIQEYNQQNNEKYSNETVIKYGDYVISKKKKIWEGDADIGTADHTSNIVVATLNTPILGKKLQIDTYEKQNNQSSLGKTYIFNIPNEVGEYKYIEKNNMTISFSASETTYEINEMELIITVTNDSFSLKGFSICHTINTATNESFNDGFDVHITRIYEIVE